MKKKVYRIEHPETGYGVYWHTAEYLPNSELRDMLNDFQSGWRHPLPNYDVGMKEAWNDLYYGNQEDYVFGFSSKAMLLRWFNNIKVRRVMDFEGFVVSVYEVDVDNLIRGFNQVAFLRGGDQPVASLCTEDLSELPCISEIYAD